MHSTSTIINQQIKPSIILGEGAVNHGSCSMLIENNDDKILKCCLSYQPHVYRLFLLTRDNVLLCKACSSGIIANTHIQSELKNLNAVRDI